ncbi:hypothetical protein I602_437 [Polaribacter dokdonensis DSW-5]|uniref:Uncharacterized protein n=1 Tax=Polaribacter dokdonensis DSW-5 TaxID=1300348 RepID=A0A0N0CES9_9FLAO|nr:hypothetical protein I602_437 [Polaribacter dokdonensis DSW-5]
MHEDTIFKNILKGYRYRFLVLKYKIDLFNNTLINKKTLQEYCKVFKYILLF